jgi:hypothetical protein
MRQHFTETDTGAEYPVCTKPLGALMRYAVGKTVREFLRTVTMTPYISQEYSSGTGARWVLDFGRSSERLSVIANAEARQVPERLTQPSVPALDTILGQPFRVLDDGFVRLLD